MTRLWWIRHGPTHRKEFIGWTDAPADLSDQAALDRLEAALPPQAIVISSDLLRSIETANAIQKDRLRLAHDGRLREMHFGDWEAKSFHEIEAKHPETARQFWENPGDVLAPKGESWNMTAERTTQATADLIATYPDHDIVIVAHFGVILAQLQTALGISPKAALGFKIDNLSLTRIDALGPDTWRVNAVNHVL